MLKSAVTATLLLPLLATVVHADDTPTIEADTAIVKANKVIVITPNPPVLVTDEGVPQSVTQPIQAPGATEMPPPPQLPGKNGAPQNEDWNNVSHINGTPVKVGERNDYLYKFKRTNLTLNPFGPFFGLYDLGVAYAVHQNIALSASITAIKDEMFQVSVTAPVYFRRAFSGPFLEGGLLFRNELDYYAYDCYDSCGSGNNGWIGPTLLMGWHWTFDVGLNISFAAGVAKKLDEDDGPDFNGYFRVGYNF